jgi:hypothetical protein
VANVLNQDDLFSPLIQRGLAAAAADIAMAAMLRMNRSYCGIHVTSDRFGPDVASFAERDLDLICCDDPMHGTRLQRRDSFGNAGLSRGSDVNLSHVVMLRRFFESCKASSY